MELTPQSVLRRLPDLRVHICPNDEVQVCTDGREITCNAHGLAILDAFAKPTPLAEALKRLHSRLAGTQDWVDLTSDIVQLHKAGILQGETQINPTLPAEPWSFDSLAIHVKMLNDRTRTSQFLTSIQEVVRPDNVVVDLGTGTGILAVAAARAGARHVYAIEAGRIGQTARTLFAANGVASQITLVEGWSSQVSPPERADVLVSEIIGNEPLGERVLEVTVDAVRRWLKPDAKLVPHRLKIYGLAVTIPPAVLKKQTAVPATLRQWADWYHMDFSPLAEAARPHSAVFYLAPQRARKWRTLGDPILLAEVDFKTMGHLVIDQTTTFTAMTAGRFNGLLVYFDLELSPTRHLSTHPAAADAECSWRNPVWLLADSFTVRAGEEFAVTYRYGVAGARGRVSVTTNDPHMSYTKKAEALWLSP